jgi:hypothetical protein
MTCAEILDAVMKAAKSNTDVALSIDSATAGKFMHDTTELFAILKRLFKPDSRRHLAALRSKKHRDIVKGYGQWNTCIRNSLSQQ